MKHLIAIAGALCLTATSALAQTATPVIAPMAATIPPSTTVGSLPTCAAATTNWTFIVTNALAPVLGSAVVGGGAVTVVVKCNGTNWLVGE